MLGLQPQDVLRRRDRAFRELGLSGQEPADVLIRHMARHPTLLERPIAVQGNQAILARPIETLYQLGV